MHWNINYNERMNNLDSESWGLGDLHFVVNFDRARDDEQPTQSLGDIPQKILDNHILTCEVPTSACTVNTLHRRTRTRTDVPA